MKKVITSRNCQLREDNFQEREVGASEKKVLLLTPPFPLAFFYNILREPVPYYLPVNKYILKKCFLTKVHLGMELCMCVLLLFKIALKRDYLGQQCSWLHVYATFGRKFSCFAVLQ